MKKQHGKNSISIFYLIIFLLISINQSNKINDQIDKFLNENKKGIVVYYRTRTNGINQLEVFLEKQPLKFLLIKTSIKKERKLYMEHDLTFYPCLRIYFLD